jgi:hypothetical protein
MTADTKDIQSLENTLTKVKSQALEMAAVDEKHLRWALGIKLVLLAFVAIYLGWAYVSFRVVDADFLVVVGQQKFYEALPTLKSQTAKRLANMAPVLMNQTGDMILDAIPKIGENLEAHIKKILLEKCGPLEKDFSAWLSSFIYETKKVIDEMFPSASSSYEKITRLRTFILEDFQEGIEEMSYEIGDSIKGHYLTGQMKRLVAGKDLTEKEKLQRDVMATWYLVVEKYISGLEGRSPSSGSSVAIDFMPVAN